MTDVTLFDYANLTPDAVTDVRAAAERIKVRMKRTTEDIVAIGLDLIAVKERLPHGAFLPWIDAEFGMGEQSARRFMQVGEVYGKSNIMLDLPATALYELAAPSTPQDVRHRVEARAEAGEHVSVAEIQRLKREAAEAAKRAEVAEASADRYKGQAETLLEGQAGLVAKAKADALAEASDALALAQKQAADAKADLNRETARLEKAAGDAESAAMAKAKGEASRLADEEVRKKQAELSKIRTAYDRKKEASEALDQRVKDHHSYLARVKGADVEAKQLHEEMEEVSRVMVGLLLTVQDVDHEHDASILAKASKTALMCRQMADALDGLAKRHQVKPEMKLVGGSHD